MKISLFNNSVTLSLFKKTLQSGEFWSMYRICNQVNIFQNLMSFMKQPRNINYNEPKLLLNLLIDFMVQD